MLVYILIFALLCSKSFVNIPQHCIQILVSLPWNRWQALRSSKFYVLERLCVCTSAQCHRAKADNSSVTLVSRNLSGRESTLHCGWTVAVSKETLCVFHHWYQHQPCPPSLSFLPVDIDTRELDELFVNVTIETSDPFSLSLLLSVHTVSLKLVSLTFVLSESVLVSVLRTEYTYFKGFRGLRVCVSWFTSVTRLLGILIFVTWITDTARTLFNCSRQSTALLIRGANCVVHSLVGVSTVASLRCFACCQDQSQVHSLTGISFILFFSSDLAIATTRTTIVATAADTGCLSQEADWRGVMSGLFRTWWWEESCSVVKVVVVVVLEDAVVVVLMLVMVTVVMAMVVMVVVVVVWYEGDGAGADGDDGDGGCGGCEREWWWSWWWWQWLRWRWWCLCSAPLMLLFS